MTIKLPELTHIAHRCDPDRRVLWYWMRGETCFLDAR